MLLVLCCWLRCSQEASSEEIINQKAVSHSRLGDQRRFCIAIAKQIKQMTGKRGAAHTPVIEYDWCKADVVPDWITNATLTRADLELVSSYFLISARCGSS
jgi:uncharacterized metal-binding protein